MEDTLRVVNELEAERIVSRYAIGGAIGFLFYTEPAYTEDLDIFCNLPPSSGLIDQGLVPIYQWLEKRGYLPKYEHLLAIAAELGRTKDKLRIAMALKSKKPDESKLNDILQRHCLLDKWTKMTI